MEKEQNKYEEPVITVIRIEEEDVIITSGGKKKLPELKDLFDPPLTKSGLNHRLNKISEIADNIRKEGL